MQLRQWQEDAIERFLVAGSPDFLIEATPGAGKTMCAAELARHRLRTGEISRLIVVVPTEHLKTQWAIKLHQFGIDCEPAWRNGDQWPKDMAAVAVTYAQVASATDFFAHHTRGAMCVLDEVHHAGGDLAWGRALRVAFSGCKLRLLLSGTPFRSDNNEIPFVRYVDGQGAPDFRYSYADALRDGVVRCVFFPRKGGRFKWERHGVEKEASFDEQLSKGDASDRLKTALDPAGAWIGDALQDAHARLLELREEDRTAGGIVVARDVDHAEAIARRMRALGIDPVVVTSSDSEGRLDKQASNRIDAFSTSTQPWIVSVKMVSEGVDIPRLRVAVYATNQITPMFFRQVVGRVVRVTGETDTSAWVYIPDDDRLRDLARSIQDDVNHFIAEEEEVERQSPLDFGDDDRPASTFFPIGSVPEDKGVIVNGKETTPADIERFEDFKRRFPIWANKSAAELALLYANMVESGLLAPTATAATPDPAPLKADRKRATRKHLVRLVSAIADNHELTHKQVNNILNQAIGVRSIAEADEDQLQRRLDIARKWLSSGVAL